MAKGFKHGAGGGGGVIGLNFDVVAYATEEELKAATPKVVNTIGVITSNEITSWNFSATEPTEPTEGMVWINTSTSSTVDFNALKENAIQVYPLSAKQYVNGAWVDVTAYSYQDGTWVSWFTYLYKAGDECTDITGGWQSRGLLYTTAYDSAWAVAPTLNRTSGFVTIMQDRGAVRQGVFEVAKDVDLTCAKTLFLECDYYINGDSDSSGANIYLLVMPRNCTSLQNATAAICIASGAGTQVGQIKTLSLDVQNLSGLYDIAIFVSTHDNYVACNTTMYNCWYA